MSKIHEFQGQELFSYQGTFVWKIDESQVYDFIELVEWPRGQSFIIPWQELKSADPDELMEII